MYGMYYGYGYFNYLIFMLPAIIIALIAQIRVKTTFSKYSKISNSRGFTGMDMAQKVLDINGVYNVRIERTSGKLTDHYDPRSNVIRLSDGVYSATSIASLGVAAHEAGHAVQHAESYAPEKWRSAIFPVCRFGSIAAPFLIIIGFIFYPFIYVGIIAFSLAVLFQLVTLPVEFNASKRALKAIEASAIFDDEDYRGAKSMLTAAAMTYVAAMLQSMLQLLYYIVRFTGRRR